MGEIVDELISFSSEAADIVIDEIIDNDVIQKIPVIGWLFSTIKLGASLSDKIFALKLVKFIEDVNSEKFSKDYKERFKDENECKKIASKLLLIISTVTEEKKLKYLGKIFCDYVNGKITKENFYLYAEIIRNVYIPLLEKVTYFEKDKDYTQFDIDDEYQTTFTHLQANSFFIHTPGLLDVGIPSRLNPIGLYFKEIVKQINNL